MSASRGNTQPSYSDCSAQRQRSAAPDHASHGHDHGGHSHAGHGHHHSGSGGLKGALILTLLVLVAEVVGGIVSNSLTLLADAGHMATDVGALALALFVALPSRRPGSGSDLSTGEPIAQPIRFAIHCRYDCGTQWAAAV